MNPLLYGHDEEERIVAMHQRDESSIRVYTRDERGVHARDERFYPFLFVSDRSSLEGFSERHWVKQLDGQAVYRFLCAFDTWTVMWDAIRHVLDRHNRRSLAKIEHYAELEDILLVGDPVTQYLLQSGKTFFKGLEFRELVRLQLDIETYSSLPGQFSNPSREGDRIILAGMADNLGWRHMVDGTRLTEKELLEEVVRQIRERDPDVIEGHNICEFDLPFLLKRSEMHAVSFAIGRDGSVPVSSTRVLEPGRGQRTAITEIAGRSVIDTLVLVNNYDQSKRVMESHGLKYAAQFFGLSPQNRTYVRPERISWYWDHDPETLKRYALDDVEETAALAAHLSGTYVQLARMLPMTYSATVRSGAAAKIEHLMLRDYITSRHSVPRAGKGIQTTGGYTDVFLVGVLEPVWHIDIESLYPSVMITREIRPAADVRGTFTALLQELTELRLRAKREAAAATDPLEQSKLDALQSSMKILINSFYGYLGYSRAMFNDYAKADEVTRAGQELLRTMMAGIQEAGGDVVEVDTDGIFFIPPELARTHDAQSLFLESIAARLPRGITVALDGKYRKMLSYKKKNYALMEEDGSIRIKGSSLTSRSMERFGRDFIRSCIRHLLEGNTEGLHQVFTETRDRILQHQMEVRDFARVETLSEALADYRSAVESGGRTRSAAYEIALASEGRFRRGSRVAYYLTGDDPNPKGFRHCKSASDWDPNFPDENVPYYLRRLDELCEKFRPFFSPRDFRAVFSADDLFPFSPEGIRILPPVPPKPESELDPEGL